MPIVTGNTNGGKSLLLSLLKQALGPLCGQMAISALTARESDPSGHNDYIARTQGMAFVMCHEPDSGSQLLMGERVKIMTSDSDDLTVREIYGRTRDMPITWKLALVCNTPPGFHTLDAASFMRTKYVAFESMFLPPGQCPPTVAQQYQQRRFPMRDVPLAEQHQLARRPGCRPSTNFTLPFDCCKLCSRTTACRRLMAMLFATHCSNGMHRVAAYSLETPPRVLAEADRHLGDLHALRGYLAAHMRPCGTWRHGVLSNESHAVATAAARTIAARHRAWLNERCGGGRWECAWEDLDAADRDPAIEGSPGWVRVQSVHLLRYTLRRTDHRALESGSANHLHHLLCDAEKGTHAGAAELESLTAFGVPYVDLRGVLHAFHKHQHQPGRRPRKLLRTTARHQQRVNPAGRGSTHAANTLPSAQYGAGSYGDGGGPGVSNDVGSSGRPPSHYYKPPGGPPRMRLDPSIVLSMAAECARCDIDNSWFIFGFVTVGAYGLSSDNDDASHLILDRAQTRLCRDWFRRFRTPLPYPTLIESADLLDSINRVSLYNDDESVQEGLRRARERSTAQLSLQLEAECVARFPDDPPEVRAARVRRAVDERTGHRPIDDLWFQPYGLPDARWGSETLWSVERVAGERPLAAAVVASPEPPTPTGWLRAPYAREPGATAAPLPDLQSYPARNALCFHAPVVPPPAWDEEAPPTVASDPQHRLNPYDATTARALLNAWAVFESAQQRSIAAQTRLSADAHGYAAVGRHPAMLPEDAVDAGGAFGAPGMDPRNALPCLVTPPHADQKIWVTRQSPDWYLGPGSGLSLDRLDASGR